MATACGSHPPARQVADFGLSRFADDSAGARSKPSLADFRNPRWLVGAAPQAPATGIACAGPGGP